MVIEVFGLLKNPLIDLVLDVLIMALCSFACVCIYISFGLLRW